MSGQRLQLILVLLLAACGTEYEWQPPTTWFGGVGAIVRTKCASCHRENGIAPFPLYTAADAREQLGRILDAVDTGLMPPFYANDAADCTPRFKWRDDPRLAAGEKALLHAWVEGGGVDGEPHTLPEPPETSLSNASMSLQPTTPWTTSGDRDQFVCFILDPGLTSSKWLTGVQVTPTAPTFVHHANVQIIPPADAAAAIAQVGGVGVPKVGCDTPPGLSIQSWLPGNPALLMRDGVAMAMPAGSLISLQVHYHPAGATGTDATGIALRLTDDAPDWTYELGVYGNQSGAPKLLPDPDDPASGPVFQIPAGRADHVETMAMPNNSTRELRVVSVTPHMHMLGTHERATLSHPDGTNECLVDSSWSFDWQRSYFFDAELGDLPVFDLHSVVDVSCHYNNSLSNPQIGRYLHDAGLVAPRDVDLGLTSIDEMCLADFGVVSPR